MSSIGRWANTDTATVWPFVKADRASGGIIYGEPYKIKCCWQFKPVVVTKDDGKEYVAKGTVWHEDPRVKYRDLIMLEDSDSAEPPSRGAHEVQVSASDYMGMFGKSEIPDRAIYL